MPIRYALSWQRELGNLGVAFLHCDSNKSVNVLSDFGALEKENVDYFHGSFGLYVQNLVRPKRYHGWDASEHSGRYKHCFVFKLETIRIYGFEINHDVERRFRLCVLAEMAQKKGPLTDQSILSRMIALYEDKELYATIGKFIPTRKKA